MVVENSRDSVSTSESNFDDALDRSDVGKVCSWGLLSLQVVTNVELDSHFTESSAIFLLSSGLSLHFEVLKSLKFPLPAEHFFSSKSEIQTKYFIFSTE